MRVVLVNKFVHVTGGADQHCLGLAAALRARGHEVRFLSTRGDENVEHEGAFVTTRVTHGSRDSLTVVEQARVLTNALWNREAAAAMERLVREFRPDVVHAHKLYPQLSVAPVVVAARHRVPVVQTLHDFELVSASLLDVRGGRLDRDETDFRFRLLNEATLPVRPALTCAGSRCSSPSPGSSPASTRDTGSWPRCCRTSCRPTTGTVGLGSRIATASSSGTTPAREGRRRRRRAGEAAPRPFGRRSPAPAMLEDGTCGAKRPASERSRHGLVADPELDEIVRKARVVVIPSSCQDAGPLVPLEALGAGRPWSRTRTVVSPSTSSTPAAGGSFPWTPSRSRRGRCRAPRRCDSCGSGTRAVVTPQSVASSTRRPATPPGLEEVYEEARSRRRDA